MDQSVFPLVAAAGRLAALQPSKKDKIKPNDEDVVVVVVVVAAAAVADSEWICLTCKSGWWTSNIPLDGRARAARYGRDFQFNTRHAMAYAQRQRQ